MKAGKYNIKELFANRYINQIIVPEIQRDYVWSEDQVNGLMSSILGDYNKYKARTDDFKIESEDEEIIKSFKEFYRKRKYASNIGFIYAYNDEQYQGKYFLIDGQQRITTIYLILLVLSNKEESLKSKFQSTYTIDGDLKLDYRVRESAHEFLKDYVSHTLKETEDFSRSTLYFNNQYDSDKTITNILKNVKVIDNFLNSKPEIKVQEFFDYIENMVEFWYFDTNVSEQGEELYIYMNARGEAMQGNENIKADLLGRLDSADLKNSFGIKWEKWQDFFWKKRGENTNADKGFNQFLSCIAGLEYYLNSDKSNFYTKGDFDKTGEIKTGDIVSVLNLEKIERYHNAIKYLFDNQQAFRESRQYSEWVSKAIETFWSLINDLTINWFADYEDDNRATERRAMVFVWSVLLFITQRNVPQLEEVFRLLRIYYVRYNNNIRAVSGIKNEVKLQVESGIWKETAFPDERLKFNLLETCKVDQRESLEELIWQIEDHPLNLNGQDVRNINIGHLVDFSEVTVEKLEIIRDKFIEVFPPNERKYHRVKHLLLYYGAYYDESSPYYYMNLKFENWRRIIRGLGSFLEENENPFLAFFIEFKEFGGTLDEFIQEKDRDRIGKENAQGLRGKLLWYSQRLGVNMWHEGGAIAISKGNPCSLPDWESKDTYFPTEFIFYNTKGDLKGGSPKELSSLISEEND